MIRELSGKDRWKKQKSHCDVHEEQPFGRPSNSGQDGSQSNIPSKVKPSGSLELCLGPNFVGFVTKL